MSTYIIKPLYIYVSRIGPNNGQKVIPL